MIKVAVLDDYQNIFREFIDIDKHKDKYDFTIFNQPFANKDESLAALEEFEALFIMRERTLISKSLISGIKNLKYIYNTLGYSLPEKDSEGNISLQWEHEDEWFYDNEFRSWWQLNGCIGVPLYKLYRRNTEWKNTATRPSGDLDPR